MNAGVSQWVCGGARSEPSDLVGHRRAQCTRSGGCLPRAPLLRLAKCILHVEGETVTIDVYLALLHEPAELGEPRGGVDLLHVECAADRGGVEGSLAEGSGAGGDMGCRRRRVGAQHEAREKHPGRRSQSVQPLCESECSSRCRCPATATGGRRQAAGALATTKEQPRQAVHHHPPCDRTQSSPHSPSLESASRAS
jgi:hypothetical protein